MIIFQKVPSPKYIAVFLNTKGNIPFSDPSEGQGLDIDQSLGERMGWCDGARASGNPAQGTGLGPLPLDCELGFSLRVMLSVAAPRRRPASASACSAFTALPQALPTGSAIGQRKLAIGKTPLPHSFSVETPCSANISFNFLNPSRSGVQYSGSLGLCLML